VDAFVADGSPGAFSKVVDRLLASPHYGERWGRHWLDVARYADGDGPENRPVYIGYGMAKDGYVNTFRYRTSGKCSPACLSSLRKRARRARGPVQTQLRPEALR